MRESDEAGRTAERATGQGIVREKEAGGWLRLWNGTKKAAITVPVVKQTVECPSSADFFQNPGQKVLTLCHKGSSILSY